MNLDLIRNASAYCNYFLWFFLFWGFVYLFFCLLFICLCLSLLMFVCMFLFLNNFFCFSPFIGVCSLTCIFVYLYIIFTCFCLNLLNLCSPSSMFLPFSLSSDHILLVRNLQMYTCTVPPSPNI